MGRFARLQPIMSSDSLTTPQSILRRFPYFSEFISSTANTTPLYPSRFTRGVKSIQDDIKHTPIFSLGERCRLAFVLQLDSSPSTYPISFFFSIKRSVPDSLYLLLLHYFFLFYLLTYKLLIDTLEWLGLGNGIDNQPEPTQM